jgi:hypothetical protein
VKLSRQKDVADLCRDAATQRECAEVAPRGGAQAHLFRQLALSRSQGIFARLNPSGRQYPAVALERVTEFAYEPDSFIMF